MSLFWYKCFYFAIGHILWRIKFYTRTYITGLSSFYLSSMCDFVTVALVFFISVNILIAGKKKKRKRRGSTLESLFTICFFPFPFLFSGFNFLIFSFFVCFICSYFFFYFFLFFLIFFKVNEFNFFKKNYIFSIEGKMLLLGIIAVPFFFILISQWPNYIKDYMTVNLLGLIIT